MSLSNLLKKPSAFLPLAMSAIAFGIIISHLVTHGPTLEADEGAAAHIFQLLMAAQLPIVVFFCVRWLWRAPRQGLILLGIQVGAGIAALAPVFLFKL